MKIKLSIKKGIINTMGATVLLIVFWACSPPPLTHKRVNQTIPTSYMGIQDSSNTAKINWSAFFKDPHLTVLIDSALANNQELNIMMLEIEMTKNEIQAKKGEYLPSVNIGGGMGVEKAARYTQIGASEATTEIKPGKEMPEPLGDFKVGLYTRWEVDIWHKLRNAKQAAVNRYLASIEGKNFMVTNLIAEIANSYYELIALDTQLEILQKNIEIQSNALKMVRLQKDATRVTELAVKRFEAQLLNTKSNQYKIQQKIIETENQINFLVGRFPQRIERSSDNFITINFDKLHGGTPQELLQNRPDIRQAEQELAAAKLDIVAARTNFYPSLGLSANVGIQAFNPAYLAKMPMSLFSTLIGDMVGPLINKNAIKATYLNANAKQVQAIYDYQRTVLSAYIEVANQISKITNLENSYDLKSKEVDTLTESVTIANRLFGSARAEYTEVLLTQRDVIEARFDLIETKMQQVDATIKTYKALGGGWNHTQ